MNPDLLRHTDLSFGSPRCSRQENLALDHPLLGRKDAAPHPLKVPRFMMYRVHDYTYEYAYRIWYVITVPRGLGCEVMQDLCLQQ